MKYNGNHTKAGWTKSAMPALWTLVSGLAVLLLAGCAAPQETLSMADAEAAGFVKDDQQIYQIVGAKDGWAGSWAGDVVELYQYKDSDSANEGAKNFDAAIQEGNISGWVERCVVVNMVMLSKGASACRELEALG